MPVTNGTFTRVWRFLDRFSPYDPIRRSEMDVALDDIAGALNAPRDGSGDHPTRAAFVSWAGRTNAAIGTVMVAAGHAFQRAENANDFDDLPGWRYIGDAHVAHWGVRPGDGAAAEANLAGLRAAFRAIVRRGGGILRFDAGLYYVAGSLKADTSVQLVGATAPLAVRQAPVSLDNSTPARHQVDAFGTQLVFCGTGTRDILVDDVSSQHWFERDIQDDYRPWMNGFDGRVRLLDLTRGDAVGAQPATLRPFSACIEWVGDWNRPVAMRDITVRLACDGASADGGRGIAGYGVDDAHPAMADYDVGVVMHSPWESDVEGLRIMGEFRDRGLLILCMTKDDPWLGYAEGNVFSQCILHGGTAVRAGDFWPVLDRTPTTITVPWCAGHRFTAGRRVRVGSSFTRNSNYTVAAVSFDGSGPDPLLTLTLAEGTDGIVAMDEVPGGAHHAVFTSGGAGPAKTVFRDCLFGTADRNTAVPEPGLGLPHRSAIEAGGTTMRAVVFDNSRVHPCSLVALHFAFVRDWVFNDCYSETRRFRTAPGEALRNRGALWIAGAHPSYADWMPEGLRCTMREFGHPAHTSANRGPLLRVGSNSGAEPYHFQNLDAPMFMVAGFTPDLTLDSQLDTLITGLRGHEVIVGSRDADGTYRRHLHAFTGGSTGIGSDANGSARLVVPGADAADERIHVRNPMCVDRGGAGRLIEFRRDDALKGAIEADSDGVSLTFHEDGASISGGPGAPEGQVARRPGSFWLRTNSANGAHIYFKASGNGVSGWVALV